LPFHPHNGGAFEKYQHLFTEKRNSCQNKSSDIIPALLNRIINSLASTFQSFFTMPTSAIFADDSAAVVTSDCQRRFTGIHKTIPTFDPQQSGLFKQSSCFAGLAAGRRFKHRSPHRSVSKNENLTSNVRLKLESHSDHEGFSKNIKKKSAVETDSESSTSA
jgi:hypothetical protein